LQVLQLAMLVQAVPPLELAQGPQLEQVLLVQEQVAELVLALRQERVPRVRAQEHLHCHQQLQ
jgi:hypothetical protein